MRTILAALSLALMTSIAMAAERLTFVVGFAAGGTSSAAARIIAEAVKEVSVYDVLVENRPGAGGSIAAEYVRRQRDGTTLFFMSSTSLLEVPPGDLVPVGIVAEYDYVVAAGKMAPQRIDEYLNVALKNESLRNVATAGAGSIAHLIGERLFASRGVKMQNIAYRGSAPAIQDVLGGHVAMAIVPEPDFLPYRDLLRPIARTGHGIETGGWIALYAPPVAAQSDVERLGDIFREASERAGERLARTGFRPIWRDGAALLERHRREYDEWSGMFAAVPK